VNVTQPRIPLSSGFEQAPLMISNSTPPRE
jgi:hypothetical protein